MSDYSLPRDVILGRATTGFGTFYTLSAGQRLRLELLTFTFVASPASVTHYVCINYVSQSGAILSSIQDVNDVSDGATVYYTFGIGLTPLCIAAASGVTIQNDLPDTVLEGNAQVQLLPLDQNGNTITGDATTDVVLYGISSTDTLADDVIPLLTPLELAGQV